MVLAGSLLDIFVIERLHFNHVFPSAVHRYFRPGAHETGCPTLATFLFLWLGWAGMNLSCFLCFLQRAILFLSRPHCSSAKGSKMKKTINVHDLPEFDPAKYLDNEESIAVYLTGILEANDAALLASALGDIARARGMTEIAKAAGITREALYRALRPDSAHALTPSAASVPHSVCV